MQNDKNVLDDLESKEHKYNKTDYIEDLYDEEELQIKKSLEEKYGKIPKACGYHLTVLVYEGEENLVNQKGEKTFLISPETIMQMDKFRNPFGMIVSKGPMSYRSKRLGFQPWIKLGDYIFFDRARAKQLKYDGLPYCGITDDDVIFEIDDPLKAKSF